MAIAESMPETFEVLQSRLGLVPLNRIQVAPGLIVEVLSPDHTKAEIDRKLNELFSAGCQLAWVIDPRAKTAKIYTSPKRFKELDESGTLDGGKVLPGFRLPLADLFAAGRRRKKSR